MLNPFSMDSEMNGLDCAIGRRSILTRARQNVLACRTISPGGSAGLDDDATGVRSAAPALTPA
jgi:hypothetical protein